MKLLITVLALCSTAMSQESNLDRLQRLYQALFDSLLAARTDTALIIKSVGTAQPTDWLIEKAAVNSARACGFEKILDGENRIDSCARLEYQSIDAGIVYQKLSGKKVERQAKIAVYLKHTAPDGRVLFADVFRRETTDIIPKSAIAELENENISITHGQSRHSALRILEPIAASALTAVIIFLFYFYRSQ